MPSVDTTYQTFKSAIVALAGDGHLPARLQLARELLRPLVTSGEQTPLFDNAALQFRFERLLVDQGADDAPARVKEILVLFEEVSAVYHVWMSQAGRSC